jgi:hypothetical protein
VSYTAERLGLTVFMHFAAQPVTMPLVKRVLAELASHPKRLRCGCSWVHKADPVKVFRDAQYWQRSAERMRRLGPPALEPPESP